MHQQFPNVKRWADADDVLQESTMRLLRSLRAVRPASTTEFFNLAAVHIRRELIDLARHFGGRNGLGARHDSPPPGTSSNPLQEARDPGDAADDLEAWGQFHEAVERLPVEEREVVGLAFYHSWTHAQIAELLQVTDRTVRRYWQSACLRLNMALGGRLPGRSGSAE
jgi:RNA polymerase sigma-70 factor (ECF subfamily)